VTAKKTSNTMGLKDRLDFETFLSNLSARFVKLESGEIDGEIELALKRLAEFFGVDRCGLLKADAETKLAQVTHSWYAEGIERVMGEVNLQSLFPWSFMQLVIKGEVVRVQNFEMLPPEAETDRTSWSMMGVKSSLTLPLFLGKRVQYLLALNNISREKSWPDVYIPRLRLLGEIFVNALTRKTAEDELKNSLAEILMLKEKIRAEAEYLRSEINESRSHEEIIGKSDAVARLLCMVEQVAPTDSSVLILGETGTGKELVARAIHRSSSPIRCWNRSFSAIKQAHSRERRKTSRDGLPWPRTARFFLTKSAMLAPRFKSDCCAFFRKELMNRLAE